MIPLKIFIIYDSVTNSAFISQILNPIKEQAIKPNSANFVLISFEKNIEKAQDFLNQYKTPTNLKIHLLQKHLFLGKLSLFFDALKLRKIFRNYSIANTEEIVCRGIFAGWLLKKALKINKATPPSIKIMLPGLAAEEALFFAKGFFSSLVAKIKYQLIKNIEKEVCSANSEQNKQISFVVVSLQMQECFCQLYPMLTPENCIISEVKKSKFMSASQMLERKLNARKKLKIPTQAKVYCYVGSLQPWQCFEETIAEFRKVLAKDPHAIFLAMIFNKPPCLQNLIAYDIPKRNSIVLQLSHQKVQEMIAAADFGFILRKPHIVNWVARPLKALEYRQNGVKIIHNMTVGWIIKNC